MTGRAQIAQEKKKFKQQSTELFEVENENKLNNKQANNRTK